VIENRKESELAEVDDDVKRMMQRAKADKRITTIIITIEGNKQLMADRRPEAGICKQGPTGQGVGQAGDN
jgi:hypothetical protein